MKPRAQKPPKQRAEPSIDPRFAPVARALAKNPGVSAGLLMASYGLKVNGKIFAMFARGRFVAKLPKAQVDRLVAQGAGERFDPRRDGRLMKEWIAMTEGETAWVGLAKNAFRFVKAGPP